MSETGFEFEVTDDFEGDSNFLAKAGTYHFIIEDVKVGVGPKGKAFEGTTVKLLVLTGTEAKKTFNHMIGFPKATDSDGGKFRSRVLSKFLLAANQVNPTDKGKKISVDPVKLNGQQVVATIVNGEANDKGKSYLEVDNGGLAVYHLDDPHAPEISKDATALGWIPKELRHSKEWFAAVYPKATPASQQTQSTTAQPPKVDIGSL